MNNVIYNIGGGGSSHSILYQNLSSIEFRGWRGIDFGDFSFKGQYRWQALVVENRILYFKSNKTKSTFILEQQNGSEKLQLVRRDPDIKISI